MQNNKKYIELFWHSKYDKLDLGEKMPTERINPFQVVETINKSRRLEKGLGDFEESLKHWPENYPKDWKNVLIWGGYKGDTFHNQWQSFRVKKNPKVEYEAKHRYEDSGEYRVMVKVVDVFGNDTNKILKVQMK